MSEDILHLNREQAQPWGRRKAPARGSKGRRKRVVLRCAAEVTEVNDEPPPLRALKEATPWRRPLMTLVVTLFIAAITITIGWWLTPH